MKTDAHFRRYVDRRVRASPTPPSPWQAQRPNILADIVVYASFAVLTAGALFFVQPETPLSAELSRWLAQDSVQTSLHDISATLRRIHIK
ncbi:MAG: hypothetical protein HZC28_01255 [Spirochaetes bacterium]|nr:hypothetical protein [Spirochaetota bacterium]